MPVLRPRSTRFLGLTTVLILGLTTGAKQAPAQYVVVPGTGQKIASDDFEDEKWSYTFNFPKSSRNLDNQTREPLGVSSSGKWFESAKRGQPDVVKRVTTPEDGLPGSKGALLIQTKNSGVPGRTSAANQQDDLLFSTGYGAISVASSPNVVVRVFIPPFEKWEKSSSTSFGYRVGVTATKFEIKRGFFRNRRVGKTDMYYPGMFLVFSSKADGQKEDSAYFIIRADNYGRDFRGPEIKETGWWTMGMSLTPDGRIHYFAKPGVDDLTAKDRIYSSSFGGTRFESFQTFFFDVLSKNDGRSWSTPWIIDDPALHLGARVQQAGR